MRIDLDEIVERANRVFNSARFKHARASKDEIQVCRDIPTMAAEIRALRTVLSEIAKMGRVCPEFEICAHPACADSSGACLLAINALSA